jgi:KipI family sensor histidine kinase inhibitor
VARLSGGPVAPRGAAPRIEPLGDSALLVTFGDRPDPVLTDRAHALAAAINSRRSAIAGIGRPVPAHASVLVPFDPLELTADDVETALRDLLGRDGLPPADLEGDAPPLEIPVRYGGPDGVDLDELAAAHGLRPAEVVDLHADARFRVLFLGFAPGFAYLGGLPPELVTPRRATPRERVPAGSVAIAGEHGAVYPRSMPGGWNLIGRTDSVLFDPAAEPPTPLRPGRIVRFVPR